MRRPKHVLRIERQGKGPYCGAKEDERWEVGLHHYDQLRCPEPSYCFRRDFETKHGLPPLFGFRNWRQAKEWFEPEEFKRLYKLGYRWRWFKAWVVEDLPKQVAFIKAGK